VTVTSWSPATFSAWSGSRAARDSSAEDDCANDRISSQCPSSMITISSDSSHQKSSSWLSSPTAEPQEDRNATVIASATSSIIPGCRALTSLTAPVRNGRPPHPYIRVPRTGEIQPTSGASGRV
jgi:hypothetical protein